MHVSELLNTLEVPIYMRGQNGSAEVEDAKE